MFRRGIRSWRFWRPLIGVVVAYAVAAQSLFIAVGGFALPAHADAGTPGFELCLHSTQAAPDTPAGVPDHPACSHCILCFAGAHHALIGAPPILSLRIDVAIIDAPNAADEHCLPRLCAHSITKSSRSAAWRLIASSPIRDCIVGRF